MVEKSTKSNIIIYNIIGMPLARVTGAGLFSNSAIILFTL